MDTHQAKIKVEASHEEWTAAIKASQEKMDTLMGVSIRATEACLERKKPTSEEMVVVVAHLEDSNGVTREETIGALKDRYGERRLAVRHYQPKKRTQTHGGSGKKLTAPPLTQTDDPPYYSCTA
jgi:hypothetical protein